MPELRLEFREVLEVWEQGLIGQGRITHGLFSLDDEQGAAARYQAVLARQPHLALQGSLGVTRQRVQVLEPVGQEQEGRR